MFCIDSLFKSVASLVGLENIENVGALEADMSCSGNNTVYK